MFEAATFVAGGSWVDSIHSLDSVDHMLQTEEGMWLEASLDPAPVNAGQNAYMLQTEEGMWLEASLDPAPVNAGQNASWFTTRRPSSGSHNSNSSTSSRGRLRSRPSRGPGQHHLWLEQQWRLRATGPATAHQQEKGTVAA
jgi:hypothetical protein